jgi:hypothetical protein
VLPYTAWSAGYRGRHVRHRALALARHRALLTCLVAPGQNDYTTASLHGTGVRLMRPEPLPDALAGGWTVSTQVLDSDGVAGSLMPLLNKRRG